jgi:hypothetical protein
MGVELGVTSKHLFEELELSPLPGDDPTNSSSTGGPSL